MAFVVAASDTTITEAAVIEWSRAHMANFKVPRRVEVLPALPRNATGKVLKYALRERARG
jgi:acyl-CoA synthetase (AMP-forming)/AMP-acid ligase II